MKKELMGATQEQQVKHLLSCIRVKNTEIEVLEMKVRELESTRMLEELRFHRAVESLIVLRDTPIKPGEVLDFLRAREKTKAAEKNWRKNGN